MTDVQLTYSPYSLINHTAVRNLQVQAFWHGLSYTTKSRQEKLGIIEREFHLGQKSIELIIYGKPKNN